VQLANRALLVALDEQENAFRELRTSLQARGLTLISDRPLDNNAGSRAPGDHKEGPNEVTTAHGPRLSLQQICMMSGNRRMNPLQSEGIAREVLGQLGRSSGFPS
jgi:hypothetical protein